MPRTKIDSPSESEVFDVCNEALGKGTEKKLQTNVMGDIRALEAGCLRIRASKLLSNDQRKAAVEQSPTDKCSNSLFASTPNKLTPFTNQQYHVIAAPLSLLKNLTDFKRLPPELPDDDALPCSPSRRPTRTSKAGSGRAHFCAASRRVSDLISAG